MRMVRTLVSLSLVAMMLISPPAARAQEDAPGTAPNSLGISTTYPSVAVEAGDQASFDLMIVAPEPTEVSLGVAGVPEGWTATFRGGGFEIDAVTAGPTAPEISLDIGVPVDAADGTYDFQVTGEAEDATISLALRVRVSAQAGGEVTLTPDFPGLRVPAGEAATFSVELRNDTPADLELALSAAGPTGWDVTAEPATEAQATTIQVDAGSTARVNVAATSPPRAESGQYTINLRASSLDTQVETEMIVEIVGSFSLDLTTADQRLSTDVSADGPSEIPLVLTNTGTAPIQGIELAATAPSGWEVDFEEPLIATLEAGQSVNTVATVTPSDQAIAGDYVITFRANSDSANSEVDIRTTVNPSALWGFVGIALIALTLAGLAWVFRRFGRR